MEVEQYREQRTWLRVERAEVQIPLHAALDERPPTKDILVVRVKAEGVRTANAVS